MKFVVGIGNPEKKYDGTRHNVGFRAIDACVDLLKFEKEQVRSYKKFNAEVFETPAALLMKPRTYVNLSGDSVSAALREYSAAPSDFLVVCDDVNLAFGKLRLRGSGSSGGHHGLESVIAALGSEDFSRLRIGVGTERMPKDLAGFVLEGFGRQEMKDLGPILGDAVLVCREWIGKGLKAATDRLSRLQSIKQGSEE